MGKRQRGATGETCGLSLIYASTRVNGAAHTATKDWYMNLRVIIRIVSSLVVVIGVAMGTAVPVGLKMGDKVADIQKIGICALAVFVVGSVVRMVVKKRGEVRLREGFGIVTLSWVAASLAGAVPFVWVADMHWYDAVFESMSGFTTTGASVLGPNLQLTTGQTLEKGIADLPYGLIYWRNLTQWLGGMGIVVLSLVILPSLGIGAHRLYRAEVPGPTEDQVTPRIADSAKILWGVYVLFSALETGLLYAGGMPLFEAWCNTCGTMATGGFSPQQASIGHYNNIYFELVIVFFMFCAGANFLLHYRVLTGRPSSYFRDEEFLLYLGVVVVGTLSVAVSLSAAGEITTMRGTFIEDAGFLTSLRFALFHVVSLLTTTGFATGDFAAWPAFCALLLVLFMFIGGSGGSTGGGMKHARVLLLIKYAIAQIRRCVFRRSISNIRLNAERIEPAILHKTLSFFFLFVLSFTGLSLVLCLLGVNDIVTAFSASIACLANIGPGLGQVGPSETYTWLTPPAKLVLAFGMLLGRLELYTVLVLFLPSTYR